MAASLSNLQTATDARTRPLVLIADDDEDTRFMYSIMLGRRGYSVIEAKDGEEAIRLAEDMRPDMVVMDVSLPRLDGFTVTRRIRQLLHISHPPIVFVSSYAEPAFSAIAFEAGCNEYLVKPYGLYQLDCVLEKYLGVKARACTA